MVREKPLIAYPVAHFIKIFSLPTPQQSALLPMSKREAHSVRMELYAFKRAVRKDPEEAERLGVDLEAVESTRFGVSDQGLSLHHKMDNAGVRAIEALVGPIEPLEVRPEHKPTLTEVGLPEGDIEAIFNPKAIAERLSRAMDEDRPTPYLRPVKGEDKGG